MAHGSDTLKIAVRPMMGVISGGDQQNILLAKWLRRAPKLVFPNEPTQGVDTGPRQTVFRHIAHAAATEAKRLVRVETTSNLS